MKLLKWHSNMVERMRLAVGWSHYTFYWVSLLRVLPSPAWSYGLCV